MNVQYAIKDGDIYVLEVNPRASRTVPFVAKVIGLPVAKIAARVMAGETLASFKPQAAAARRTSASRRRCSRSPASPASTPCSGPEMHSTGEVMGLDRDFAVAFAKSQLGGGARLPRAGTVFVSVRDGDKPRILPAVKLLAELGFKVIATSGTQRYLAENGVAATKINKVLEGRPHIVDAIKNGEVQLVFNTTEGATALADSRSLRRAALLHKVPYYTTLSGAVAAAQGIKAYLGGDLEVRALQSYFGEPSLTGRQRGQRRVRLAQSLADRGPEGNFGPRSEFVSAGGSEDRGAMEKIPMTAAGYTALENELKHRQQVERPRIIQQITEARTHGDLSENAEYHAAKEQQSLNEGRIAELEDKLARAEVIDVSKLSGDTIKFGATVTLIDEDTDKKQVWQIVGEPEADAKDGKISITSPLARALIGKKKGAQVEVVTPGGAKAYEVDEGRVALTLATVRPGHRRPGSAQDRATISANAQRVHSSLRAGGSLDGISSRSIERGRLPTLRTAALAVRRAAQRLHRHHRRRPWSCAASARS